MDTHQAPTKTLTHNSGIWRPVEINDPALQAIERQLAEQDQTIRATLERIAAVRGVSVDVGEELRALQEICAPTVKVATAPISRFATRC